MCNNNPENILKVAGNFHVTAGKSLPLMRGHAHLAAMMGERDYNFREDNR